MKVIISVNPINIDTTYSIAIPYTDINRLKYCSIRSKNAVFNNIFIDTGGGAAVFNGNYYVVTLLLTTTTKTGDKITGRGKGMEVDKKPLNASSLEIKYNNYLPFYKDKAGVSIYSGLVGLVDRTSNSIYDDTETNGTIKIGYAKGLYSGLYLDTHKKILYLKP